MPTRAGRTTLSSDHGVLAGPTNGLASTPSALAWRHRELAP
ncbi:hypothetical protein [Micromonospora sp. 067-2]